MNNCILSTILPAGKLNNASDNSSSHSKQSCPPPTRCAQDITRLPQRLTVSVPTRCATIKVASVSDMNNQDGDQWYTLPVTILNSSSRVPLNCSVVALVEFYLTCLFTLLKENSITEQQKLSHLPNGIMRKSGYSPNATCRICFYHAGTSRGISGIHSVLDEEGDMIVYYVKSCCLRHYSICLQVELLTVCSYS